MNLQDFKSQIDESTNVLIVLPYLADADAVATSTLMYRLLDTKGKKVTVASSRAILQKYSGIFQLANYSNDQVINEIKPVSYVVSVAEVSDKVDVSWNKKENKIDLVLTPESGEIDFDKISYSREGGIYDLVITINVSKLDDLGAIYTNHSKLYEGFKIISVGSELKVNGNNVSSLIDDNYSTTSEVLYKNYADLDGQIDSVSSEIAAYGIVGNTNGLQRVSNSRTYGVISEIANKYQVDVPAIVRKYFYAMTKDEVILRERILKNLKFDESRKAVYSVLTKSDLGSINLNDFDFNTILPFNVNGKYDFSFLVFEEGITSNAIICCVKPETKLDDVITRAKGVLGKNCGLIRVNSGANDAATRILNVLSGGSLDEKIVSQVQPPVKQEAKPVAPQPAQNIPQPQPAPQTESEAVEPMQAPAASPFTKATEYVVDANAEPMKKANYFSSGDKPFDTNK